MRGGAAILLMSAVVACPARADDDPYRIDATGAGYNPAQRLSLRFDGSAATITPPHGAALVLRTVAVGRRGGRVALPNGQLSARGARVEQARPRVVEWFESSPAGVEHGWDLGERPGGDGPLEIAVAIEGGRRPVGLSADRIAFLDRDGVTPIFYGQPAAADAVGRSLPMELEVEGDRVVVRIDDTGAQYPLRVDPLVWGETNALTGPEPYAVFSWALDFDEVGSRLAVTAPFFGDRSGRVFVYRRTGATWALEVELGSPDPGDEPLFGTAVAIEGDVLAVGAYGADPPAGTDAGAVYVFRNGPAGWRHAQTITAPAPYTRGRLGVGLALEGGTLAVAACPLEDSGSSMGVGGPVELFFFAESSGTWSPDGRLSPGIGRCLPDATGIDLEAGRVAFTTGNPSMGERTGTVLIASRERGVWAEVGRVHPTLVAWSVAITASRLVAGTPDASRPGGGRAHVYELRDGAWTESQVLRAPSAPVGYDFYANEVEAWGDRVAVGSQLYAWPDGSTVGAVFLYRSDADGGLVPEATFAPPPPMGMHDGFGRILAAVGDRLASGSIGPSHLGVVRIYGVALEAGDPCALDEDCLSGFCTDGVCCDARCGTGDPGDCQVCSAAGGAVADGVCSPGSAGGECRASAGVCDVPERCTGAELECPTDALVEAGVECRASAGSCDAAETCDGLATVCPIDARLGPETICRASRSACDPAETCDSAAVACPPDITEACPDAAAPSDAGTDAAVGGTDGGATTVTYGACGCRVGGGGRWAPLMGSLLALVLARIGARRRRRPQRGPCGGRVS